MNKKIFKLSYIINYAAPPLPPNNLVVLADTTNRNIYSYKRAILDKNGNTIGEAAYLIYDYRVELSPDKKSGIMYGSFTATHEFEKNNNIYDIFLTGNSKWILGLRSTQSDEIIDIDKSHLYILRNDIDCISANSIFINKNKINHGDNKLTVNRTSLGSKYKIIGKNNNYQFCL
jgi:hypothetical protein